jgi:hypothetical protein
MERIVTHAAKKERNSQTPHHDLGGLATKGDLQIVVE